MIRKPLMISAAAAALTLGGCDLAAGLVGGGQSQGDSASAASVQEQMRAALSEAPKHGLTKDLFFKGDLQSASEPELRKAILEYASALADGKVDPENIRDVYTVPRPKVDVNAGFEQALSEGRLLEWLNSLAPQTEEYRALSKAFVQLVERTPDLEGATIPSGDVIKVGDTDSRVPAIAQNLRAQGYGIAGAAPAAELAGQSDRQQNARQQQDGQAAASVSTAFTPEMARALAQWQADSGLEPDGIVGPNTVEALNGGPKDRARKLAVAMERLRWLEREVPATRIDVNTAAAFLRYWRDGKLIDQRRVVVGEPGWETPQLGSPIFALVANPDWVVPESIVEEEISKKSQSWLRQNNFTQKNGRWVQEPGPQSALGLVKFAMENDQAIYLHDTPHKALFNQPNRHESHGCVRVHNAVQFAQMIAQASGIQPQFQQAMEKDEETQVELQSKIPVRLMYHTAYLGSSGRVQYAEDVYGWDNDVASALGYERRQAARRTGRSNTGDLGP